MTRKRRIAITPECRKHKKEQWKLHRECIFDAIVFGITMMLALLIFILALPRN